MDVVAETTDGGFRSIGELAHGALAAARANAADHRRDALLAQMSAILSCVTEHDLAQVQEVLAAWLEDASSGGPYPALRDDARYEAEFWASMAAPHEIEAYTAIGLRAIERRHFAPAARKRILVAMWESMGDRDRAEFLRRVDPTGKFRGR